MPRPKRSWTEEQLKIAVNDVANGRMSDYKASHIYNIPRTTIRNYVLREKKIVTTTNVVKKPTLSKSQEADLVKQIKRLSDLGNPLTTKIIRAQAYLYCKQLNIPNTFNKDTSLAGKDWMRSFLARNLALSKRIQCTSHVCLLTSKKRGTRNLSEISKLYDELKIHNDPMRLFNMVEKDCRLTVFSQDPQGEQNKADRSAPTESVTIVGCANALGDIIPPMIILKGKNRNPEYNENLPAGSIVTITPKGFMTNDLLKDFIHHFAKHKPPGKCLLIFDGSKLELDINIEIIGEAEKHDVVLYNLPFNQTQDIHPLHASCYKSFECYWDKEFRQYLHEAQTDSLTQSSFCLVFAIVWSQCMTRENITSGFRTTGLYPFDHSKISQIDIKNHSDLSEDDDDDMEDSPIPTNSEPLKSEFYEFKEVMNIKTEPEFEQVDDAGLLITSPEANILVKEENELTKPGYTNKSNALPMEVGDENKIKEELDEFEFIKLEKSTDDAISNATTKEEYDLTSGINKNESSNNLANSPKINVNDEQLNINIPDPSISKERIKTLYESGSEEMKHFFDLCDKFLDEETANKVKVKACDEKESDKHKFLGVNDVVCSL